MRKNQIVGLQTIWFKEGDKSTKLFIKWLMEEENELIKSQLVCVGKMKGVCRVIQEKGFLKMRKEGWEWLSDFPTLGFLVTLNVARL